MNLKTDRRWLAGILFVAVALRLAAAFYLGEAIDTPAQARIQDQVSYNALAKSLLAGQGYSFPVNWYPFTAAHTPTAHWSFLYPLYLAAVYGVVGFHPLVARIIQAVIAGLLSTLLVYHLGKKLFGETVGLVAGGLVAVYAYLIYHDAALMTEPFFILGILAMFALALRIADGGGRLRDWAWLGLVLGATALLRQTILLWLPFLLAWLVWSLRKRTNWWGIGVLLVCMGALILPWTIRNYIVYKAFLPLNSNAGFALYSANHPHHGTHFIQDYVAPLPADLVGQGLNEAQWNSALTLRGLQFVLQDPQRYILLSLDRIHVFFNFSFSSDSDLLSNLMRVLSFGLYLPFFLLGLFFSRQHWKQASLIYLFVVIFSLMHILTWASVRYRLPIDAVLMPFAALAVVNLARWVQTLAKRSPVYSKEINS